MKKILLIITLLLGLLTTGEVMAGNENTEGITEIKISMDLSSLTGYSCNPIKNKNNQLSGYNCEIPKSTKGIFNMVGNIIKYFAFLASIIGVLAIVIAGILYTTEIVSKDEAKKLITRIITGIIILFSSGYILQIIAPWIYK